MRVLLLHPDDDFHGWWTSQHWDSVIDLGQAPKSFYDERSAALGCPVYSVFDFAVEVGDLQVWRHLLELGMGRVVDRFGIDWWDVIGLLLQPQLQDVQLALRLAHAGGKPAVGDGRSFATSVGNTAANTPPGIAEAPGAQLFASQRDRSEEPEF